MSSIQEVAKNAGVSTATVSRTFNMPGLLKHETRERVLQAADLLNYRPRRRLAKGGNNGVRREEINGCLGFLFFASETDSDQVNTFYASVLMGAQEEASRIGVDMFVRTLPRRQKYQQLPDIFRDQSVAGLLLVGAATAPILKAASSQTTTAVLIDNQISDCPLDSVISDSFGGVKAAMRHLIDLGHRKIGFVLNEPTAPSFQDRLHGYICAHYDSGLVPNKNWILMAHCNEIVEPMMIEMLRSDDRPTAIIAANDMNAFSVMSACRQTGLSIPDDISLIGFDDIPFSVHSYPPLTTMAVNKQHLGRLAVRQLQQRIFERTNSNAPAEPPVQITVPVSLIQRGTCRSIT